MIISKTKKQGKGRRNLISRVYYHAMMTPGMLFLLIFNFIPMFGLVMAFQDFKPAAGIFDSPWVGLKHFQVLFDSPLIWRLFRNTLVIAAGKILFSTLLAIVFSILLNEIRIRWMKKSIQTIVYLPHFLSWVVLAAVVANLFRMSGSVNSLLGGFGIEPINFLGSNDLFQPLLIGTHVWKEFGYCSIVYLAAITSVDLNLHEAAAIDGASWFQRVWHVTLPAMLPIIMLMAVINVGNILNAGFDQIYNLYSEVVYETGDILDTYIYRSSLQSARYSFGTAVGLLKSIIGIILMVGMNGLSRKLTKQSVF